MPQKNLTNIKDKIIELYKKGKEDSVREAYDLIFDTPELRTELEKNDYTAHQMVEKLIKEKR